jgi:hypothetical protein
MIMPEFLTELADKAGVQDDQAHHGIGAFLAMLKSRLDPGAFERLKEAIPNSDHMLSAFEGKAASAGGGLLDTIKGMAGSLLGKGQADPTTALQSHLAGVGISPEQLKTFLPRLHAMLADKLPAHVMDQIRQHVPAFGPPPE